MAHDTDHDARIVDGIAAHVAMIATLIREMRVSREREGEIAASDATAVMAALEER